MRNFIGLTSISVLVAVFGLLSQPALGGQQVRSENGMYVVSAEVTSQPAKVGRNEMMLTITETEAGKTVEGADVEVVPWMPTHEHGTNEVPEITEKGHGQYMVRKLNLTMPGDWEVYVRIKRGRKEGTAVVVVSVK